MQTGFEIMDFDKHLKELWMKRILAGIVDFLITLAISFFVVEILFHIYMLYIFLIQGLVWYFYSALFDAYDGKTPGKYLFGIKSVAFIGNLSTTQAFVRNLTKLNVVLVLADIVAGLSTEGDPRQRYLERAIDSLVINERKKEKRLTRFKHEDKGKEELILPR